MNYKKIKKFKRHGPLLIKIDLKKQFKFQKNNNNKKTFPKLNLLYIFIFWKY